MMKEISGLAEQTQANTTADATAMRLRRRVQRAESYVASGDLGAAIASLEEARTIAPDDMSILLQLAMVNIKARRHNPARALAMQAVKGNLASPMIALQVFALLGQLGESRLMVEIAKQLPPPMWDSARSLAEFSQNLNLINANELAREYALAGVARDPGHAPSLYMLATAELFFGNLDAAAEYAKQCLKLMPGDPGSHWLLSRLRQPGGEQRIEQIEQELARTTSLEHETWLAYSLHNELHDLRDYDRAWSALARACRAKRSVLNFQPNENCELYQALQTWTAAEASIADGFVDPTLTPIFVVGLHRSGTTLAERIISGHSKVTACGETYDISTQLRRASGYHFKGETDLRVVNLRNRLNYSRIGEGYLQGIRWRSENRPFVTDKLPSNFLNIGFIARALPNARFIHMVRDPVDVGLSNLRTLFNLACPYSYDQIEFADHYHRYKGLMKHWHAIMPGRILDVEYDALVSAPAATAAAMAQFCGLDFEPGMIEIEKRTDAVATASSVMMRDGIRKDRGKVWHVYEKHLQPMIAALARSP